MKTVLITGGSSGIGYEVSKYFAKASYRILWVSKPIEELKQAKANLQKAFPDITLDYLALDLSEPESPTILFDWTKTQGYQIDVLINNAGFGTHGFQQETDISKELSMIQLHVSSLYHLTRLFLDEMLARDAGSIINISSISALQPVVRMNTYASTKAFVRHFSRGLYEELQLQNSKVHVMTVCPAAISNTAFKQVDNMAKVKTFDGIVTTTAEVVAKDIWQGFLRKRKQIITGSKARWLYKIDWLIPNAIQRYLTSKETEVKA